MTVWFLTVSGFGDLEVNLQALFSVEMETILALGKSEASHYPYSRKLTSQGLMLTQVPVFRFYSESCNSEEAQ